ncbi:hypothetical protein SKAU_G00164440 [Synaphobranchus kaupii]|uniref:Uncharacterized protein n=1 Tax=Synaphobranchus kaupii TaxID=118154 RepID=A0A9Q1FJL6_SYNKA|nr:hypothetical protein SKAU_G00164440 [Synaphobranchus kaupii]
MPHFNVITNVMILNNVGILSAVLQLAVNLVTRVRKKILFITSIVAFLLIIAGYVLFVLFYILEATNSKDEGREITIFIGLAIAGRILVSLNWWENYSNLLKIQFLENLTKDIKRCRNIICIISSVVRIGVTAIVLGAYVKLQGLEWSSVLSVSQNSKTVVLSLFAIQVLSSALCHWFVIVACKMHAVRRSFVIPMWLASPAVLLAFVLSFGIPFHRLAQGDTTGSYTFAFYCQNFTSVNSSDVIAFTQLASDVTHSLCAQNTFLNGDTQGWALLESSVLSWWFGLLLCTTYIWFHPYQRIERTKDLFVCRLYEGAFIDQSMLLNACFDIPLQKKQTRYTLPYGNILSVHYKDKQLIRHKKRWSQKKKENTYILALDGDIDFQPSSVMLLLDHLRLYPEVGAVSGRVHPSGTVLIILVNDRYDLPFSIKDDEHDRRAAKHPHIPNVFPKPEDRFPGAAEFNELMVNSGNKVRLQKLVKEQLTIQKGQVRGDIIYCEGEMSTNLGTGMSSEDYVFKHPDADTMLLSAYAKLRASNYTETVVLDCEDTDVYVQAVYVSQQLQGDLLIKRKHAFINCRGMITEEVADIIIPLHVITGSDHTSGFYGHGKKKVLEKVTTNPEARELLGRVGQNLELEDGVRAEMKAFVLSIIYAESADVTCGQARASKWHKLKTKSTIPLPPDDDSLNLHIERANFIAYCQLHYNLFEHPSPIGHGWELVNGKCRPVRHTLPPLPQQLTLHDCPDESSDDERSECGESTDSDEE